MLARWNPLEAATVELPKVGQAGVSKEASVSKFRYLLEQNSDALRETDLIENPFEAECFVDRSQLLADLWAMFSWLAPKPGDLSVSRRRFHERAPELFRKFPQIATSFGRLDKDGNGCVSWDEFQKFCLSSPWMQSRTRKLEAVTVFGRDAAGNETSKDDGDATFMCEMQVSPQLLPWELSHTVKWRLADLLSHPMWDAPKIGNLKYPPGKHVDSPPFNAAGARGFLRYWPAGQYGSCQQKLRSFPNMATRRGVDEVHDHAPGARGCCVGLVMPVGTHLKVRFFVGGARSDVRDICWSAGNCAAQVWAPLQKLPPCLAEGEQLVVGVEILKNYDMPRKIPHRSLHEKRRRNKPRMQEFGVTGTVNGFNTLRRNEAVPGILGKTQSLPSLAKTLASDAEGQSSDLSKSVSLPRLAVTFHSGFSSKLPMGSPWPPKRTFP